MSSGSLRELGKALSAALAQPATTVPLSEDLLLAIQQYRSKHVAIDDNDSQKLQDDLLILYKRHVSEDSTKHACFLAVLRELRQSLLGIDRQLEWWNILLRPTVETLGKDKAVVSEARAILLDVLVYEEEEDGNKERIKLSQHFTKRLIDIYLEKTRPESLDQEFLAHETDGSRLVAEHVEALLVTFGRRRPKSFMRTIDELVSKKDNRTQALSLLSSYLRQQPPHLYQVLQTPLINSLLNCLLVDTSTTALSLALTDLVMFLPHIPSSLPPLLPRFFIVYSRILCWERYGLSPITSEGDAEQPMSTSLPNGGITCPSDWEKLEYSFETADSTTPELSHFFTFLYGLYPINFMDFIRDPSRHLRNKQYEGADSIEMNQEMIRQRTEKYRRLHNLHPHFYTKTDETELFDPNRWVDSEPADIVAECMALCASPLLRADDPGPPPTSRLPELPPAQMPTEDIPSQSLLSMDDDGTTLANEDGSPTNSRFGESWTFHDHAGPISLSRSNSKRNLSQRKKRTTRSSGARSTHQSPVARPIDAADSPTLPALPQAKPEILLQDMLHAQEKLRGNLHSSLANESVTSLHANEADSPRVDAYLNSLIEPKGARSPAIRPSSGDSQGAIAFLQREVVLLKNDLNFVRYLKQQHVSHIGQLQRKYIKEATVEAETQNLINKTRALNLKLEEAKRSYALLKHETSTSKNHSKKWENELNAKIRTLREEQKQWRSDEGSVRRDLQNSNKECEQLRKLVVAAEAKELLSSQKLQSIEADLNEVERLRTEAAQLQVRLRELESKEKDFELATHNEELARTELEMANLKLKSRDSERDRFRKAYEIRIDELEDQLEALQSAKPGQAPKAFQAMVDSALASSHSRFTHLKKTHNELYRRYRDLDMRYMDLKAEREREQDPRIVNATQSGSTPSSHQVEPHKFLPDDFDLMAGSTEEILDPEAFDSFDVDGMATSPMAVGGFAGQSSRRMSQYPNAGSLATSPNLQRSGDGSMRSTGSGGKMLRGALSMGPEGPKIKADSTIRVYGRGGVQNIGKKDKKDKETRPASTLKGLRGFM